MFKPLSTDPKCSFSVSVPVSILKALEKHLEKRSRSELIREAILFWLKAKNTKFY